MLQGTQTDPYVGNHVPATAGLGRFANSNDASVDAGVWYQETQPFDKAKDPLITGVQKILTALKWTWIAPFSWQNPQGYVHGLSFGRSIEDIYRNNKGGADIRQQLHLRQTTRRTGMSKIYHELRESWRDLCWQQVCMQAVNCPHIPTPYPSFFGNWLKVLCLFQAPSYMSTELEL